MSLIITRHMEAEHNVKFNNKQETFAGNRIDTALTERGKQDARSIAKKIAELGGCSKIYTSPMLRTRQTADLISQVLSEQYKTNISVEILPDLEEVDAGDFTGLTREQAAALDESLLHIFVHEVVGKGAMRNLSFPNGEDYQKVVHRLEPAISKVRQDLAQGKHIALVSHANTIKVLLEWLSEDHTANITTHSLNMTELDPTDARDNGIKEYNITSVDWQES